MPCLRSSVKDKFTSPLLVDLHFHGAFGIDLVNAIPAQLRELSERLWSHGIGGFCPTTLSLPARELKEAVMRLGMWIRLTEKAGKIKKPIAKPLGIHLEGPFINPKACGAHSAKTIRPFNFHELEQLWEASRKTLKILTMAPELLSSEQLKKLAQWARQRRITLSLGHSRATEDQAHAAFAAGFTGVTHAWNALSFHHRAPGALGAALGNSKIHVELILDRLHVAPSVIGWTLALHPNSTCFVSDCAPATGTHPGSKHSFGNLKIHLDQGACRLSTGHLAGGGMLLSEAYAQWLSIEAKRLRIPSRQLFKQTITCLTTAPLKAIGIPTHTLANRRVLWKIPPKGPISWSIKSSHLEIDSLIHAS